MDYKKNGRTNFGWSDIATLVMVSCGENGVISAPISTGADGDYKAYITDNTVEIPEHYSVVFSGRSWLRVYDDEGLVGKYYGKTIKVYKAISGMTFIVAIEKEQ